MFIAQILLVHLLCNQSIYPKGDKLIFSRERFRTDITRLGRFRICTHHGYYDVLRARDKRNVWLTLVTRDERAVNGITWFAMRARLIIRLSIWLRVARHTASSSKTGFLSQLFQSKKQVFGRRFFARHRRERYFVARKVVDHF
jgi:hypothetical protein